MRLVERKKRVATAAPIAQHVRSLMASSGVDAGLSSVLVCLIVALVFFSGFINLLPGSSTSATTSLTDFLISLCGIILILSRGALRVRAKVGIGFKLVLVLGLSAALQVFLQSFSVSGSVLNAVIVVRSIVLYSLLLPFVALELSELERKLVRLFIQWCGLVIAVVGILQSLLAQSLPKYLLATANNAVYSYAGTSIVRSTGLVGNTIVYASLLLLMLALWASRIVTARRPQHVTVAFGGTALVLWAILSTYSRITIVGAGILLTAAIVMRVMTGPSETLSIRLIVAALLGFYVIVLLWASGGLRAIQSSFYVRDLFSGSNVSVSGSTAGHQAFTNAALNSIAESPIFGVGLGATLDTGEQLTDGALLSLVVGGGIILLSTYLVWVGLAAYVALWGRSTLVGANWPERVLISITTVYSWTIESSVNSGMFGKPAFIIFWIILGTYYGTGRVNRGVASARPNWERPAHQSSAASI